MKRVVPRISDPNKSVEVIMTDLSNEKNKKEWVSRFEWEGVVRENIFRLDWEIHSRLSGGKGGGLAEKRYYHDIMFLRENDLDWIDV